MLKVTANGNLTADVEVRTVNGTSGPIKVGEFTLACNRSGEDKTDFIKVETWGKLAEACEKYLKKGSRALAHGNLEIDTYEKDGVKRTAVKIAKAEIEFQDRKPKEPAAPGSEPGEPF